MRIALYPGTFDPITKGHMDVVSRAVRIFDRLVIGVASNPLKQPFFSFEERIDLVKQVIHEEYDTEHIEVIGFECLTVDLARKVGATALIRGLRAVTDFEYELQIALTNRNLARDIESVFLMPSVEYIYLNSSVVKEVAKHGGDISDFVHDIVGKKLRTYFNKKKC
ncbi:pantetheine-phosphate adenylyltransferase [bacterium]|nr:pantetheine-phosphate adenylyltransferase [bacterium]